MFTSFRRGKKNQTDHQALLKIQGANSTCAANYYLGKRVAYITKVNKLQSNTKYRVTWGKIIKTHGNNGVVRAKFNPNLPAKALGSTVRVMLYPQH